VDVAGVAVKFGAAALAEQAVRAAQDGQVPVDQKLR